MQSLSSFAGIIGNWKSSGEVLQPGVDPMLINGTDTYEWVLADFFILHRVNVMMGKEQVEVIELIGGEMKTVFLCDHLQIKVNSKRCMH